MEKLGTVENITNGNAEIKVIRDSACGDSCAACGLCPNREMTVTLPAISGLEKGDTVRLVSDTSAVVKKTVLGYTALTLLLLLGGVAGTALGSEWLGFGLAFLFAISGVLIIRKVLSNGVKIHIEKLD